MLTSALLSMTMARSRPSVRFRSAACRSRAPAWTGRYVQADRRACAREQANTGQGSERSSGKAVSWARLGRDMPVGCARAAEPFANGSGHVSATALHDMRLPFMLAEYDVRNHGPGTQRSLRWKSMNLQCAGGFCPALAASPPSAPWPDFPPPPRRLRLRTSRRLCHGGDLRAGARKPPPAVIVAATPLPGRRRRHLHARQHCAYRTR